nr:CRISPR-associated helicase Cas3' [Candidatus Cloacimonadota bacterium]
DCNVILIAPTGSGKTESALGWLSKKIEKSSSRTFYILPFTASINAMHQRLAKQIENKESADTTFVGIHHGKLIHYLAHLMGNDDYTELKKCSEQFKMMIHPLKITTPFQVLKYLFGVKGFEIGFTNLCGANLIFDEIHAYDVITFAQILVMLEFLSSKFKCNVFIMTATLPTFMLNLIQNAIPKVTNIYASPEYLSSKIRHRVKIFQGTIFSAIEKYLSQWQNPGRSIIVCNTVQQAQDCYLLIKSQSPNSSVTLLHGRFNSVDRMRHEQQSLSKGNQFLIGTQAIEVSLDIDYDLMITEPAPLDALLQRFGRVNRHGKRPPASVFVCTEGSKYDNKIYPQEIVDRSLKALQKMEVIHESDIQGLIDEVYPDWFPDQRKKFEEIRKLFNDSLASLQPYSEHKESEEAFYEHFTGVQVLPGCFFRKYVDHIQNGEFVQAEELLVGIHEGTFNSLFHNQETTFIIREAFSILRNGKAKTDYVFVICCKYDSELGLLLKEREDFIHDDNMF